MRSGIVNPFTASLAVDGLSVPFLMRLGQLTVRRRP